MRILQNLKLQIRVKADDTGVFPAVEAAAVLERFVLHLRKSAYSTSLAAEGKFLHMSGGIEWSLDDGKSDSSPEAGLDEGVRSPKRHADSTGSGRDSERPEADDSGQSDGKEEG